MLDYLYIRHENEDSFIFFLHNRFIETHELNELHPEFERTEYNEIVSEFEKRNENINARVYAIGMVNQFASLLESETEPKKPP